MRHFSRSQGMCVLLQVQVCGSISLCFDICVRMGNDLITKGHEVSRAAIFTHVDVPGQLYV